MLDFRPRQAPISLMPMGGINRIIVAPWIGAVTAGTGATRRIWRDPQALARPAGSGATRRLWRQPATNMPPIGIRQVGVRQPAEIKHQK